MDGHAHKLHMRCYTRNPCPSSASGMAHDLEGNLSRHMIDECNKKKIKIEVGEEAKEKKEIMMRRKRKHVEVIKLENGRRKENVEVSPKIFKKCKEQAARKNLRKKGENVKNSCHSLNNEYDAKGLNPFSLHPYPSLLSHRNAPWDLTTAFSV